jgi:transposase
MLSLDHYELIRRKHLIDGLSIREISRTLGHSRKTIRKALKHATPPGYQREQPAPSPVMAPVAKIVDAWLEQDQDRPRKQRHTAQRVYERLRDEHDFKGSSSTVRRYMQKRKTTKQEVFLPLRFEPGEEGQVDWHTGHIIVNGQQRKAQFFCMRLCYSKASFVAAYEHADMVSFLDGHVRAFEYFGGVPKQLAYDNLKSAVTRVGKGKDRVLNETFKKLRCHYLFKTRFCNVARGNEKGDVENLAKRSERTYLTPLPEVTSLSELNEHMLTCCRKDLQLPATGAPGATRGDLLHEERPCFIALQPTRFEACEVIRTDIDKRSLVTVQTNRYSAPVRWAHHAVTIKLFVDSVELWCEHQRVAVHKRCHDKGKYTLEPRHYLKLLERKPGGVINGRPFKGMIGKTWGHDFELLRRELEYRYEGEGTKKFVNVLLLFTKHREDEVRQAVSRCVRRRAFSDEAVLGVLNNEPVAHSHHRLDLSHRPELVMVSDGIRSAALYDRLLNPSCDQRTVNEEVVA